MIWTAVKAYLFNLVILLDQAGNTIFLAGEPDETISLHSARACDDGKRWGCIMCRLLDVIIAKGHCQNTEISERQSIVSRGLAR